MSKYKKLNNSFPDIISYSATLMKTLFVANKVTELDSTILITGESETGEERIAKVIQKLVLEKISCLF
ncbi:sigma 54-interacting transcriptional regulator [Bacillus thuringiensis]|uniref:sigma 54-interacting transcriptional regulator n=1 Tax=Bacillus thuringiensis TaxID=1428 RepID=UPI003EDEE88E